MSMDTRDEYYQKEIDSCNNVKPKIELAAAAFHKAMLESKFRDDFEKEYGGQFIRIIETDIDLSDESNIENKIEESKLVQEYFRVSAAPVTEFHGEKMNFYGLAGKMLDTDRSIRIEAFKAWLLV